MHHKVKSLDLNKLRSKMKKSTGPIPMITHFGKTGLAIGDCRAQAVPLRTDRQFDIPIAACGFFGESREVAATKRLSFRQWLRSRVRPFLGVYAWW